MPNFLITRRGVHYFNRRVPAKLIPIIGKECWRETLSTTDPLTARKEAAQRNADCEAQIAIALLEYRRQRSAVARLTPDERAVVQGAGGLAALRKRTVGEEPAPAVAWRSLPADFRTGLPPDWTALTREQRAKLTARWGVLSPEVRTKLLSSDRTPRHRFEG